MLLPRIADNSYRGYWLALWIFGLVVLLKTVIGVNSMWMGHTVATSADGIPVDSFGPAGAHAVVSMFAAWGLGQVIICALCWLVLIRYRTLIPLMFLALLVELVGRKVIFYVLPIAATSSGGSYINLGLFVAILVGFGLSLWQRPSTSSG
ncbi:MAG TPA: hypothetical protein VNF68_08635 [Candidatus Baltobacteraceae bacterium]|nr:hypothetical protein [Candidatus Baltobacteraceae bacterium]